MTFSCTGIIFVDMAMARSYAHLGDGFMNPFGFKKTVFVFC